MSSRIASFTAILAQRSHAFHNTSPYKRLVLSFSNNFLFRPMANVTPELRTMKLDTPQFKSIFNSELVVLVNLFKKYHYDIRIAGGAVRDLLSGKTPDDIDFATTATPDEMKIMFESEGIRMLNMKGERHGTITCRINDKENFEVTTLRIDVRTDGRHAEVEFTKDWELDALRRDLTINSMFLGFDGTVYDYFRGSEDLSNCKVRFVGNPVARIQEDYLRILRYFRFYGRVSTAEDSHEEETLKSIRENMEGLADISGERIWTELKKILGGSFVGSIVRVMLELGLAKYVGLPTNGNIAEFERVWERSQDLNPGPMTLLTALLETEDEVNKLHQRVKLSREELRLGLYIISHRNDEIGNDPFAYCQDLLCDISVKEPKTREKICELMKYLNLREALCKFTEWDTPKFPVSGHKLLEAGVPKGPVLAKALNAVRAKWKDSRYTSTEEELLMNIEDIVKELKEEK